MISPPESGRPEGRFEQTASPSHFLTQMSVSRPGHPSASSRRNCSLNARRRRSVPMPPRTAMAIIDNGVALVTERAVMYVEDEGNQELPTLSLQDFARQRRRSHEHFGRHLVPGQARQRFPDHPP